MHIRIKQRWGLLFLLIVAIAYIIFSFLSNPTKNDITEIYFADRISAAHKILIDKYNKLNEGKIKVIPIDFPNFDFSTDERKELLARSLIGRGEGIDIFAVDLIWVQRFAKWSEPLDNYFSNDERNRILSSALESCYYDNKLVAIPLNMVQGILYYREDILKKFKNSDKIIQKIENGITWEEFIKLKKTLNIQTPFYIFPATNYEGFICCFMENLLSLDRNYFHKHGFNFNTPEAEQALQLLVDIVNKYNASPKEVTKFTEVSSYEYFIKNDGLFIRGWPSYDKDFKETPFDLKKESNLKKAPLPYFKSGVPTSVFGGWNLMVSKFSNKKEKALDFVKFLLKDESQEIFYTESGYYPVINNFYEKPEYQKKYPEIENFKAFMKSGVHRPANINYTKYSKIMSFYFKAAIQRKITVKQALTKSSETIKTDTMMIKEF
jgi:multiple sugar transport system substrate-binding protein